MSREIDLERTTYIFLITHVLEKGTVVLRATTDEIHGVSIRCTVLGILAAVVKTLAELFSDVKVQRLDCNLTAARCLSSSDIEKISLVWGASERTVE
jgi:hypothetical protein